MPDIGANWCALPFAGAVPDLGRNKAEILLGERHAKLEYRHKGSSLPLLRRLPFEQLCYRHMERLRPAAAAGAGRYLFFRHLYQDCCPQDARMRGDADQSAKIKNQDQKISSYRRKIASSPAEGCAEADQQGSQDFRSQRDRTQPRRGGRGDCRGCAVERAVARGDRYFTAGDCVS